MSKVKHQVRSFLFAVCLCLFFVPAAAAANAGETTPDPEEATLHNPYHQQSWTPEQKEVWRTIEEWNQAFKENDPDTYFTYIADEVTLVLPSGPYRVEGKPDDEEEFRFLLNRGATKVGFFQEMQPQVTVIGEMAFVSYYSRGFYGEPEGALSSFKETTILKKTPKGWKIIHIHLSK